MINSRGLRNVVAVGMVVLLASGGLWARSSAKPASDGLLRIMPARSLFCVRINKLTSTLAAANEFLKDVAPESFDAEAALLSKLGELLGDERLRGVNTKGNFAIFGLNVPGESAGRGPMGNIFIGALIPVRNYDNFISRNSNCGEPDDEGISTITLDGRAQGLVTNFRRFALLCSPNARDKLSKVKKLLAQRKRSLGRSLDPDERKLAASSPLWLYLNVKQGSKLIQPLLFGGLEMMKAQLEKAKESGEGPPIDPAGIIGFYGGMLKMLIEGTENITVAVAPTAEACNVTLCLKPVPDTTMAAIVGEPLDGDLDNMMGYLEDGAMMNLASKVDHKSLNTTYMKLFELMGQITTESIPEADLKQLKKLTTKMINAMGDSLAMSFGVGGEDSSLFSIKYVIKVKKKKAFEKVIEKELRMMQEGALAKLYKGFGMEMDIKVERDADTYKGISIDAAKVAFRMGDEDSPQSQMLKKIWGDGLDYRWAFVDGYCTYSIGGDADKTIRELIDQVRTGGPKQIGSEMKAALEAIPDSDQADVVGTLNYVRVLNMALGFMPLPGDVDRAQLKVPTDSNVAFAGRTTAEGKMTLQMALPKKHLQEIKSAFENLIPKIREQEKLQRQKQKEQAKEIQSQ